MHCFLTIAVFFGVVAEWSKAVDLGSTPQGHAFILKCRGSKTLCFPSASCVLFGFYIVFPRGGHLVMHSLVSRASLYFSRAFERGRARARAADVLRVGYLFVLAYLPRQPSTTRYSAPTTPCGCPLRARDVGGRLPAGAAPAGQSPGCYCAPCTVSAPQAELTRVPEVLLQRRAG